MSQVTVEAGIGGGGADQLDDDLVADNGCRASSGDVSMFRLRHRGKQDFAPLPQRNEPRF